MRTAVARELDHSIASATVELLLPLVSYLCSCPVRDHDMDKLSLSACSRIHQHTSCLLIIRCARSVTQAEGTNTSTHVNRVWHLASGDIMILLHAWSMALILFQVQKNAVCNSKMHSRGTAKSRGIAFENKNKKMIRRTDMPVILPIIQSILLASIKSDQSTLTRVGSRT